MCRPLGWNASLRDSLELKAPDDESDELGDPVGGTGELDRLKFL